MVGQISQGSFVPNPPDFTAGFFDSEPKVESLPQEFKPSSYYDAEIKSPTLISDPSQNSSLKHVDLYDQDLGIYFNFMNQCVLNNDYQSLPYGVICPGHPEAKYPYPGPKPTPPSSEASFFKQFIHKGLSKEYRQQQAAYADHLSHWKAQMENHLLEVPLLIAKDSLFKAYFAFLQKDYESALDWLLESTDLHPFNPEAYALESLIYLQMGEIEKSTMSEVKFQEVLCPKPLNELGHQLIEKVIKETLKNTYKETCQDVISELDAHGQSIPLDASFFHNMIQSHFSKITSEGLSQNPSDFFDRLGQYFLEQLHADSLKGEKKPWMESLEEHASYLHVLFEAVQENLHLIGALDKWSEFSHLEPLDPSKEVQVDRPKEWLREVLKELTQPISFGDPIFKRSFMMNAMRIQLAQSLFELKSKPHG